MGNMDSAIASVNRTHRVIALAACVALVAGFAATSLTATLRKSATFDEPLHATAAWVLTRQGDFRVNPEDPCLWHYWAALPNGRDAMKFNPADKFFKELPKQMVYHWP